MPNFIVFDLTGTEIELVYIGLVIDVLSIGPLIEVRSYSQRIFTYVIF